MNNVVVEIGKFTKRKPDPQVWEHSCGCQHFYLLDTGQIECRECLEILENKFWNGPEP